MAGKFITFEGGEGVGKTTQISLVKNELTKKGFDVLTTREPGGTVLGEKIREILRTGSVDKMSPMAEALLFTAAREYHINKVIKPALKENKIVLCDRFVDTTFAYQGIAHGLGVDKMQELYKLAVGDFYPDLTIIFDIDKDKASGNYTVKNRFENMGDEWLKKGVNGFREIAKLFKDRCVVIDSTKTIPEITSNIVEIITKRLLQQKNIKKVLNNGYSR